MFSIKETVIDNQFCICRFSFYKSETLAFTNKEKYLDVISDKIDELLYDKEIYPVGKKDIKFVTDIEKNELVMGVAKMAILIDIKSLPLPTNLSIAFAVDEIKTETINSFNMYLRSLDLVFKDDIISVDSDSTIIVTTEITIDDHVVHAPEIEFDAINDLGYDINLFIGHKVNDKILIEEIKDEKSYAIIKRIYRETLYTEENNLEFRVKNNTKYRSFKELKDNYFHWYQVFARIYLYTMLVVREIIAGVEFDVNPKLYEFYHKRPHYLFFELFESAYTKEEKMNAVKSEYFLDVFDKMLFINYNINNNSNSMLDDYIYHKFLEFKFIGKPAKDDLELQIHLVKFLLEKNLIKDPHLKELL